MVPTSSQDEALARYGVSRDPHLFTIHGHSCLHLMTLEVSPGKCGWFLLCPGAEKATPPWVLGDPSSCIFVDVFLELSCFLDDPADVGNLISGSSAFSKTSLNIWKFMVHALLKPGLENFAPPA